MSVCYWQSLPSILISFLILFVMLKYWELPNICYPCGFMEHIAKSCSKMQQQMRKRSSSDIATWRGQSSVPSRTSEEKPKIPY